jgi:RNA polymerase sigma-70 factor (TIGR02960 family)
MTVGTAVPEVGQTQNRTLVVAQAGDERAFGELTQPLLRELHVHCYRMLGSLDDADDALQETLLRAWRQLDRFEPRAPFRAWLYRIATNVCLTSLAQRARRGEVTSVDRGNARDDSSGRQGGEQMRLDPYPDRLLDELAPSVPGPEVSVEQREGVELAFVAAVQLLPPRQRATLLLRDVIGYTAAEAATMLETSVAGINSALQRARATLERERSAARITRGHAVTSTATEDALVRRLIDAWHAADITAVIALLTDDVVLSMPPQPERYVGRDVFTFLATVPGGGRLDRFRLVPTRANRQPAVGVYYRAGDAGDFRAHALLVLAIRGEAIASLVRFADSNLFDRFELPATFDG